MARDYREAVVADAAGAGKTGARGRDAEDVGHLTGDLLETLDDVLAARRPELGDLRTTRVSRSHAPRDQRRHDTRRHARRQPRGCIGYERVARK